MSFGPPRKPWGAGRACAIRAGLTGACAEGTCVKIAYTTAIYAFTWNRDPWIYDDDPSAPYDCPTTHEYLAFSLRIEAC